MINSKRLNDQIKYSNRKKMNTDFSSKDLRRSNCFNCDFTQSNFDETSFRGAQFKGCNFSECSFNNAEIIAANLKKAKFKNVKFQNTLFDSVSLEGADFEGASFKNVIFVATDISKAINLELTDQDVKIFEEMPALEISEELQKAAEIAMKNEFVKYARVLDTKEGKISAISMMRLLEKFDEETVIRGLKAIGKSMDKDFCTLTAVVEAIEAYKAE